MNSFIVRKSFTQFFLLQNFSRAQKHTKVDEDVQLLNSFSDVWWNSTGYMRPLHSMNTVRVPFIRDGLISTGMVRSKNIGSSKVLDGLKILDVGCGGGILAEPLAQLHANVTGLDLAENLLNVADAHLPITLKHKVQYRLESIENHAVNNANCYDAIVTSEVIEHITEKHSFLAACVHCLKPGGSIFITTMTKTPFAGFAGIFLAENVFKLISPNIHHYEKFITPEEVERMLASFNCKTVKVNGLFWNFLQNKWFSPTFKMFWINYALHAVKNKM